MTHMLGVLKLLHEAPVLLDAGNVERLHLGADSEHKVVIVDSRRRDQPLDLGRICVTNA